MAEEPGKLQGFACDGDVAGAAASIVAKYRDGVGNKKIAKISTDDIKELLAAMRQGDQDIRVLAMGLMGRCGINPQSAMMKPVMAAGRVISDVNREILKNILRDMGWPVISIYGELADQSAFLIAQHADRDSTFQKFILKALEEKLRAKETSGKNYALLFDRVRVAEQKP